MASSSSSSWRAGPGCAPHLRGHLERLVNASPIGWRDTLETGERFESLADAERRLTVFALVVGFAWVKAGGSSRATPGSNFKCIHHGNKTLNTRKLEDHVVRNKEGKIVSKRRREMTGVHQTGCEWSVRVSFKGVIRGRDEKAWILSISSLEHEGHDCTDNPLAVYPHFMEELVEFRRIREMAISHRTSVIAYSASRRVLESEEFGLSLTSRQYYNLVRKMKPDGEDPQTIVGLLAALEDQGFVYSTRVKEEVNAKGEVVSRKLIQIWFTHPRLIEAARRFVSDFVLIIDGTFNTNELKLPLLIAVGILNSGKTFPVAFEWCPGEDRESFAFFWECIKSFCFDKPGEPKTVPMRVVLGDQAAGLTASLPDLLPGVHQQFCNWHACQNICTRLRAKDIGRKKEDFEDKRDNRGNKVVGLRNAIWEYLQETTDVAKARSDLVVAGGSTIFRGYIENEWQPKEYKVVEVFINKLPNLGCAASSRGESYHIVMRRITNAQLSLEDSAKRLASTVLSIIKDIDVDEAVSMRTYPRIAQTDVFRSLQMRVSKYAIELLEREWRVLTDIMLKGEQLDEVCECPIRLRYGIACRHHLLQAFLDNTPLPKTLLHPRWWLGGPPITATNWKPFYPTREPQPQQLLRPSHAVELAHIRQQLVEEERLRFDIQLQAGERQIDGIMDNLMRIGQQRQQIQEMPIGQPDANPRSIFWKRSVHGKANQRGLIANEILDRQERRERQEANAQARQQPFLDTIEVWSNSIFLRQEVPPRPSVPTQIRRQREVSQVPESPVRLGNLQLRRLTTPEPARPTAPLPTTPQTRFSGLALPTRTPEAITRARPRRSPSPEASPIQQPPASTAPPQLGRGKRPRAKTAKQKEAQAQGLVHESQERHRRAAREAEALESEDSDAYGA